VSRTDQSSMSLRYHFIHAFNSIVWAPPRPFVVNPEVAHITLARQGIKSRLMRLWCAVILTILIGLFSPMESHAISQHENDGHDRFGLILAFADDEGAHIEHVGLAVHEDEHEHLGVDGEDSHHTGHIHLGHDLSTTLPVVGHLMLAVEADIRFDLANQRTPSGAPTSILKPPTFYL